MLQCKGQNTIPYLASLSWFCNVLSFRAIFNCTLRAFRNQPNSLFQYEYSSMSASSLPPSLSEWRPKSVSLSTNLESTTQLEDLRLPWVRSSPLWMKAMPWKEKRLFRELALGASKHNIQYFILYVVVANMYVRTYVVALLVAVTQHVPILNRPNRGKSIFRYVLNQFKKHFLLSEIQ